MTASKLVFVELDARGLEYVRENLTGVNPFCTALLDVVLSERGKVFTLVPAGTPPERLHRFQEGALLPENLDFSRGQRLEDGSTLVPVESLQLEQAAYLASMVRETEDSACIVDDFNSSWASIELEEEPTAFGVGDDVYHLLTRDDAPDAYVTALDFSDTLWHGVAAIVAQPPELEEDRSSTPEALEAAAYSVLALTCTAYDGEGFVVWRRAS